MGPPTDRRFTAAQRLDEQHGLSAAHPALRALARQSLLPGTTGSRARQWYVERIEVLTNQPFVPAPTSVLSAGDIVIGNQVPDGTPITLSRPEFAQHTHVVGTTGGGKSSFLDAVLDSLDTVAPDAHRLYLDQKDDWRAHAVKNPRCLIITPTLPIAMLATPQNAAPKDHRSHVRKCLTKTMYGAAHIDSILQQAMDAATAQSPRAGLGDTLRVVNDFLRVKSTYQFQDSVIKAAHRLNTIEQLRPGLLANDGWTIDDLANHDLYVYIPGMTSDVDLFFFTWLVEQLYLRQKAHQRRDPLTWVIVMDEATTLWQAYNEGRIQGTPFLSETHSRVREYGIAFVTTSTSSIILDRLFRSNTGTQVATRLSNAAELRDVSANLGLTTIQENALRCLPQGQCIIRLSRWQHPILASFQPPTNKHVDDKDWNDGIQRTEAQTPQRHATPPTRPTPQPVPAPGPQRPRTLPSDTVIPPVTLTAQQTSLLQAVADLVIPTSTIAYKKAGLTLSIGDASAKHLEILGLLDRNPIIARPGRGGSAISLELTKLGWERLNQKPPHQTRGGDSAQHRYLVHHLAHCIPGSKIEATVGVGGKGGKSVDILVRITDAHERLLNVIASNTTPLAAGHRGVALGDLVGIEVEVSDPNKTATPNAVQNHEHGINTTIIAVMPKALDATRKHLLNDLPGDVLSRVILVDALQLLEGLR